MMVHTDLFPFSNSCCLSALRLQLLGHTPHCSLSLWYHLDNHTGSGPSTPNHCCEAGSRPRTKLQCGTPMTYHPLPDVPPHPTLCGNTGEKLGLCGKSGSSICALREVTTENPPKKQEIAHIRLDSCPQSQDNKTIPGHLCAIMACVLCINSDSGKEPSKPRLGQGKLSENFQ